MDERLTSVWLNGDLDEPYAFYEDLRREGDVIWCDQANSWLVTGYSACVQTLRPDGRISANRLDRLLDDLAPATRKRVSPLDRQLASWVQFYDAPDHARLRSTASALFTPKAIARLRDDVRSVLLSLMSRLPEDEPVDIAEAIAYPLPATVIASMLGIPAERIDEFKAWTVRIGMFLEATAGSRDADAIAASDAIVEMEIFLDELVRSRHDRPTDDVISYLVTAYRAGELSLEEVYGWCTFLLHAGHETTTGLITNMVVAVLGTATTTGARLALNDPRATVEEALRFDSPVQRASRIVLEETTLGHVTVHPGDRVWAMVGAANRDPSQFTAPNQFDPQRSPNKHLSFGYGAHLCIGAFLARLEGEVVVEELLRRRPMMALAAIPNRQRGISLHRWTNVDVVLGPDRPS